MPRLSGICRDTLPAVGRIANPTYATPLHMLVNHGIPNELLPNFAALWFGLVSRLAFEFEVAVELTRLVIGLRKY